MMESPGTGARGGFVRSGAIAMADGPALYLDGDTLVIVLPPEVRQDISGLVLERIRDLPSRSLFYILIDLSRVKLLDLDGTLGFMRLVELARKRHIHLLMLDTPAEIRGMLEVIMPGVSWIDTCPGAPDDA